MFPIMMLCLVKQGLNSRLSEAPSTSIQGFFLTPNNSLCIGVFIQVFFQLLPREGVELLDTGDSGRGDVIIGTVFVEGGVNLPCTEDDAVDFLGLIDGFAVFGVLDYPLEAGITGKLFNGRTCERVAE